MAIKAKKPVSRESSAIVDTAIGSRPLIATLFEDELRLRPKRAQHERRIKLSVIYAANLGAIGEDEGMKESGAEVRTAKGMRQLLVAIRGASLIMRPKGMQGAEILDIAAAFDLAIKQRVAGEQRPIKRRK